MASKTRTVRMSDVIDRFVADHARAAAGGAGSPNYTRSLHALLSLAMGNASSLRHDLYQPLGAIGLSCVEIRGATRHPEAIEGVERIERAVQEINRRVSRPGVG